MGELLVLDPSEVAEDRVEVDITAFVGRDGPDFGDAAIEAAMSQAGKYGQSPVDFTIPNRIVTIPLSLIERNDKTFAQIRREVQAKAARFQHEGGWLKRETALGPAYADVVNATLKLGAKNAAAWGYADADAVLTLECLPEWYEDWVELDSMSETTLPEIAAVLQKDGADAVIRGDYPARCRIVVSDAQGQDQLGLIGALRCRNYSSATSAALAYGAEDLDPLDTAAVATVSGASGGASNNVIQHTNLGSGWTPVLGMAAGGATYPTHIGAYRVWARLRSPNGEDVRVRFIYDVGDLTSPVENEAWSFPAADRFYLADLGDIQIGQAPFGAHRWSGQIQAQGANGGEDISVDRVWLQPLDESAWRLRAPARADVGLADYVARDEFNQSAGALNGKTASVGGNWATAGVATDFAVETTGKTVQRSTAVAEATPRIATLPVSMGAVGVAVDLQRSTDAFAVDQGVVVRYVDANNYLAVYGDSSSGIKMNVSAVKVVGGTPTVLASGGFSGAAGTWQRLVVIVDAQGRVFVFGGARGATPALAAAAQDSALATAGALASGAVGLYDRNPDANAITRSFDSFAAWVPSPDAAIFASRSAQLRTEGMYRLDASGTAPGPQAHVVGDLPRLPPSGLEERPVELFLKASRGDLEALPDSAIDDITVQVFYRPCWLFVPGEAT